MSGSINQLGRMTPNGSLQIPIEFVGHQTQSVGSYPVDMIENMHNGVVNNGVASNHFMQTQADSTIQYIDGNGNLTNGIPAFISADGSQIILKDSENALSRSASVTAFSPEKHLMKEIANSNFKPANSTSSMSQRTETPSRMAVVNGGTLERPESASLTEVSTEVMRNYPKSVKATQSFWYKPKISRDEAITLLKDKPAGTFLIRDSNNFQGAFGLALKVDKPPPNVQIKPDTDPQNELVRHFLIEPVTKGVRIKGCCNEPTFGSLAALVYQHSLTPLALPCLLILPTQDLTSVNLNENENRRSASSQGKQAIQNETAPPQVKNGSYLLERGAGTFTNFKRN
jgi:hypothetical protein